MCEVSISQSWLSKYKFGGEVSFMSEVTTILE